MSKSPGELVREFHVAFGRPVRETPDVGTPEERVLRVRLMLEEVLEFAKAAGVQVVDSAGARVQGLQHLAIGASKFADPDLVQMAHELADIQYVVSGTGIQLGIPIESCVEEIHQANMRKLGPDGKPILDADGKVLKPPGWKPADVERVVRAFGCAICDGYGVVCGECGKEPCTCSVSFTFYRAGPCPCECRGGYVPAVLAEER